LLIVSGNAQKEAPFLLSDHDPPLACSHPKQRTQGAAPRSDHRAWFDLLAGMDEQVPRNVPHPHLQGTGQVKGEDLFLTGAARDEIVGLKLVPGLYEHLTGAWQLAQA